MPGTLFVVATPIGNLDDITARALRVLRDASIIAAEDTRRTAHLLARYGISTATTSLHEHNEAQKMAALMARLGRGDSVALVSDAGTPTISDPGQRLIAAALGAGIRVESVPGPSAITAALAVSGLPTNTFTFLGFPPARAQARIDWFERVSQLSDTVIFFEAPHRIRRTLDDLQHAVGDCEVAVCREMTKAHEQLVKGPISAVIPEILEPRGEFTVVADLGHKPESKPVAVPDAKSLLAELGEMTELGGLSRRSALSALAKRHNLRPNMLYELLEDAKKSGE